MLQKKYRLKKYSAFIATYRLNNIISDENVCIYFGKEKQDCSVPTKFAFVVSKKISNRAVVRNKIKRLMRESFRLFIKNNNINNINKYISVICVAKKNMINSDFSSTYSCLEKLMASKS